MSIMCMRAVICVCVCARVLLMYIQSGPRYGYMSVFTSGPVIVQMCLETLERKGQAVPRKSLGGGGGGACAKTLRVLEHF